MTDDIVTRLREIADADVYMTDISVNKLYEAVDEIERLRALVNRWQNCELVAESLCLMDDDESFCNTCKELF